MILRVGLGQLFLSKLKIMKKLFCGLLMSSFSLLAMGQTSIYFEDFESANPAVSTNSANGSTNLFSSNSTYSVSGTKSYRGIVQLGDTIFLETNAINASTSLFLTLKFSQICKIDFFDKAIIQVSTNNGSSWTTLTSAEYNGSGFLNANGFSSISYSDWNAANGAATPTNSWWKSENFDLSNFIGSSQLKIRFALIDADNNGARSNYGWLIDDIEVISASCELIPPTINLAGTSYVGQVYSQGPYPIQADIQDQSGISSASLSYSVNNGASSTLAMTNITGNIYQATIPGAIVGDTVCYSITATDATSCANSSSLPSLGCFQFIVNANPPPSCVGTPVNVYTYNETFASFTPGNGANSVGVLANNWENASSGDTHNWWVYNTGTTSNGTGPSQDHSPGDANYMYVEASGSFANTTAHLNTPCYDFSNLLAPKFRFWYHMYGATMGSLHLDIFFGGQWVQDIMPVISGNQGNNWFFREVDLSAYAGNIVKLRFRANVGTSFTSDIAIDDIEIYEPLTDDIELTEVISPIPSGCSGTANEFVTVKLTNLGSLTQSEIPLAYQLNGGAVVRDTARVTIPTNSSANFTFQQTVNMTAIGSYSFDIWNELASDLNQSNDSTFNYAVSSSAINSVFPDTTDFDSFVVGTPGTLLNGWSNSQDDAYDWFVNTGGTASGGTGPSGDHTSGSGNYMYIEATNSFNLEAALWSKCYDINNLNKPELTFYYHMNGATMGDLHVDIIINGFEVKDIINPIVGNQGPNWNMMVIDLSPFKGVVKVVFRGITGTSFTSDIAIDDVSIRDAQPVGLKAIDSRIEDFAVFPNPAKSSLSLKSSTRAQVLIRNVIGSLVYESNLNGIQVLDVSEFSSGIYFVEFISKESRTIKRLVIQ